MAPAILPNCDQMNTASSSHITKHTVRAATIGEVLGKQQSMDLYPKHFSYFKYQVKNMVFKNKHF